jgi:hypothetical protein
VKKWFSVSLVALSLTVAASAPASPSIDVPSALRRCWAAVAPLHELAESIGTPVICTPSEYWGGTLVEGVAIVWVRGDDTSAEMFQQIAVHELGHGYDFARYVDADRAAVGALLGWDEWNVEAFADVFAVAVGCWFDQGTGWRQAGEYPAQQTIAGLQATGLLPSDRAACATPEGTGR